MLECTELSFNVWASDKLIVQIEHLERHFSYKELQLKKICCPAENIDETLNMYADFKSSFFTTIKKL